MRISFLGDISLNNRYDILYNKNKKPFNNIYETLSQSDYVIGNLEYLSAGIKENIFKRPRLKINKNTLSYLSDIHLNISTFANNHAYHF